MRCRQCGREMFQIGAMTTILSNGKEQITKTYRCRRCGKTQETTEVY